MARVVINAGACGFCTVIVVRKDGLDKNRYMLEIETDCKNVARLADDIAAIDMRDALTAVLNNPVYKAASRDLKHPACPVPAGILKALEVEAGLNVPRNASINFEVEK